VTGHSDRVDLLVDTAKQFLCKYTLQDLVSTKNPEEDPLTMQMSISPNPASGQCNILLDHTGASRAGILKISNAQGIVVFSQEIALSIGSQSIDLDAFVHFPAGVYQVSILTAGRLYIAKVVKAP
jgi:Secretion system C-terminal sorting domain